MIQRIALCTGCFLVVALSNAIVPVLPEYASGPAAQGAIFSAYFLCAFLTTLPAGLMSDRWGKPAIIQAGILITVVSGVLIVAADSALTVLIGRGLEGVGAGLFIASSLSWVNSRPDHERLSGYFMASLNLGLVVGLIGTGWLVLRLGDPDAGLILFTALAVIPTVMSFSLCDGAHEGGSRNRLRDLLIRYAWLWYSSVVLIGVTGVVTALYPAFSGNKPDLLGIQIASMGVATVGAVLIVSHLSLPPVRTIRTAAVLMAAGVLICFVSPWGFVILGALAGTVQIAQMAFLAESRDMQGAAMGLFSAMSYAGMTFLPFLSGLIADRAGFFVAFTATALIAMSVAVTIGRCKQSCAE